MVPTFGDQAAKDLAENRKLAKHILETRRQPTNIFGGKALFGQSPSWNQFHAPPKPQPPTTALAAATRRWSSSSFPHKYDEWADKEAHRMHLKAIGKPEKK